MNSIQVVSLPLDEVIRDIAEAFKVSIEDKFGEKIVQIPVAIGSGTIKSITFDGGLGIIQYDCLFMEDTEIEFTVNEVHPLKFLYVMEGTLHHRFANEEQTHELQRLKNALVASRGNNGHVLSFKKNEYTSVYSLEMDRTIFQKKRIFYKHSVSPKLAHLFQDKDAVESFYYEGDYSVKMATILKESKEFDGNDFLHAIFLESIAYQTLVLQITQFLDDQQIEKNRTMLRRSEIESIVKAAEYIDANLGTYGALPSLTNLTGLNGAKLQEGFKYLYDKTVNQYVFDARLQMAKDLLLNSDDSVSEIVYKIGLSSKSYFSSVFKEEFGTTPSSFRKKNTK